MTTPASGAQSIAGSVLSTSAHIGRYFSLTSALPSTFLLLWTYALVSSGAATGRPQLSNLSDAFSPTIAKISMLVLAVLIVGLFMHPLQFGMTQLFEGYWGTWSPSLLISSIRVNFYRRRVRRLTDLAETHKRALFRKARIEPSPDQWDELEIALSIAEGDGFILHELGRAEAHRKRSEFPTREERIMPTRLGNALRRYEDMAGEPYRIDGIKAYPHFSLVARPEHWRHVEDSVGQMDATLRLCVVSIIATVEAAALLITDGPWLLLALAPYGLAYLAYRGCVSAARDFGTAFAAVVDLNRFELYESLQMRRPASLEAEQQQNENLMAVVGRSGEPELTYRPQPGTAPLRGPLRTRRSALR